jgi:hypothetical protein
VRRFWAHSLIQENGRRASELGRWDEQLHDLGEAEVKHGVKIHLYNFYNETLGNAAAPAKPAGAPKTYSESDVNIE